MKRFFLLFAGAMMAVAGLAQKIDKVKTETMFKTPVYWKNLYDQKLRLAPPDAVRRITDFNNSAATKGYTFQLAYTSVWGKPIANITGGRVPDMTNNRNLPNPLYNSMPLRANRVRVLNTASDSYVDMRQYGIVTRVGNQNPCGSCWAFATVAALETASLLKNGGDAGALDLSEQQVLTCTGPNNSCGGGWNNDAASYVCNNRIATEGMNSYTAMDGMCNMGNTAGSSYKGRRWGWVGSSVREIKEAIIEHGSVASCFWVSDEVQAYGGGVYNLNNQPTLLSTNHVIQIIGWDDAVQAWLIKNSWGDGWGEGGFAWIKYGTNNIGAHTTWVEAEEFGDMSGTTNNPYSAAPVTIDFATADYNTLQAQYAGVSKYRIISRQSLKVLDCDDPVGLAAVNNSNKGRRMIQWDSHNRETLVSSDGYNQEWFFIQSGKRGEKPVYKIFNNGFTNFLTDNGSGKPVCENGSGTDNQLWFVMPQGNKSLVKIKNVATGKFVEVPAGNNGNGAEILMANASTGTNQLFDLNITAYNPNIPLEKYFVIPKHSSNTALDITAGNTNNGTRMQLWQKINNNGNQTWKLTFDGGSRYFRFHPAVADGRCLEVLNISMDNGAGAGIWDCWEGLNQDWLIIRIAREDDKFIIFNRNSGKCLDAAAWGRNNGTAVQQWDFVNGDNQRWKLEKINP
jgi:C1A family cysteine protease